MREAGAPQERAASHKGDKGGSGWDGTAVFGEVHRVAEERIQEGSLPVELEIEARKLPKRNWNSVNKHLIEEMYR